MTKPIASERLARTVAHVAASFEHVLLGRSPTSISVVADRDWMVLHLHEPFSATERRLALDEDGARRVRDFHHYLFDHTLDALLRRVTKATGVEFRGAIAHVDLHTGSVLKTLTTRHDVDLFLLGPGLPALGVPINDHLHASATIHANGNGAVRT
jgi:uncharacterized protein YbcI